MAQITMARALNTALRDAMEADDRVVLLGEDVGTLGGVFRITDGLTEVSEPVFDRSGKYMFFFASTDAGPARDWFAQSNADMESTSAIYVAVLPADGHDDRDSTSVNQPVPGYTKTVNDPVKPLTIGVPREFFGEGLDGEIESAVKAALKEYQKLGAKLVDVSLPSTLCRRLVW